MAYSKFQADWKDYPDTSTPITEAALEHLETGIFDGHVIADAAIEAPGSPALGDAVVWTGAAWDKVNHFNYLRPNNILVNGSFAIWQRGNGPFSADGFSADAWKIAKGAGSTISVEPETSITVGVWSPKSMKITYTHGSAETRIRNRIIAYQQLRDDVLTFRCRVKSSVASAIRLGIADGVGTTYSSYHTGGGAWETLVVSRSIDDSSTLTDLFLSLNTGSGAVFYVDECDCVSAASAATAEWPRYWADDIFDDLVRCQKFYQRLSFNMRFGATAGEGRTMYYPVAFKAETIATPTISLVSAGTRTNISTVTYAVNNQYGAVAQVVAAGNGECTIVDDIIAVAYDF